MGSSQTQVAHSGVEGGREGERARARARVRARREQEGESESESERESERNPWNVSPALEWRRRKRGPDPHCQTPIETDYRCTNSSFPLLCTQYCFSLSLPCGRKNKTQMTTKDEEKEKTQDRVWAWS
jgi:hypothetical protein